MKTNKKGFTIIELMVTVAIIAILTGIVVANASASRSRARDAKRISDMAALQLAFELYFDRCNQYPVFASSGTTVTGTPTSALLTVVSSACPTGITLSSFLGTVPTAPLPGSAYTYAINSASAPTDYVLRAVLENSNTALVDDVDGTPISTPCDDGNKYYCVQPR